MNIRTNTKRLQLQQKLQARENPQHAPTNNRELFGKKPIPILTFDNGNTYTGEHTDEQPHGKGEMIYANGDSYSGRFAHGQLHGKGKYTFANG